MFSRRLLSGRGARLSAAMLLVVLLLAGGRIRGQAPAPSTPMQPRGIDIIAPGTVVEGEVPQGWTHTIVVSHPRVAPEEASKISATTAKFAGMLSTAFLARVDAHKQPDGQVVYRLGQVAVGVTLPINGKQTVVSPETQEQLGANLGFLARRVLDGFSTEQKLVRVTAQNDTMTIVDTPVVMLRGQQHRKVFYRYSLLVDPRNGRLDTLLWLIDIDDAGKLQPPASQIQWLASPTVIDAVLHVDTGEFTLGVPSSKAFAVTALPGGRAQIPFPQELLALAGTEKFTPEAAHKLEVGLWDALVRTANAATPASR